MKLELECRNSLLPGIPNARVDPKNSITDGAIRYQGETIHLFEKDHIFLPAAYGSAEGFLTRRSNVKKPKDTRFACANAYV